MSDDRRIGPGLFVPVVGPSGAGKDSLMEFARRRLGGRDDFRFARRVITRPSDPLAEAHDTMDEAAFACAEADGAFALSWRSHGLSYGIPVAVDDVVRAGGVVVANVSRGILAALRARYANVLPVLITVSPGALAARLAARGRESDAEIAARIERNAAYSGFDVHCRVIDNSGSLEDAGEAFVLLLQEARAREAFPAH